MDWGKLIIEYGVVNILKCIVVACEEKAQHYKPSYSTFQAYADAINLHLLAIRNDANRLLDEHIQEIK